MVAEHQLSLETIAQIAGLLIEEIEEVSEEDALYFISVYNNLTIEEAKEIILEARKLYEGEKSSSPIRNREEFNKTNLKQGGARCTENLMRIDEKNYVARMRKKLRILVKYMEGSNMELIKKLRLP